MAKIRLMKLFEILLNRKKKNAAKTDKFEADFYSRGIFRAKDIPKNSWVLRLVI